MVGDEPDYWQGRSVLVTGASGFIGRNLVERLLQIDCEVSVLSHSNRPTWLSPTVPLGWYKVNFIDRKQIYALVKTIQPSTLFQLAAAGVGLGVPTDEMIVVNIGFTGLLLDAIQAVAPGCRFIYTGSCFEYGEGNLITEDAPLRPTTVYGATKAGGFLLAQSARSRGLDVITVRPFTPFGVHEAKNRLVPYIIMQTLKGEELLLTGCEQQRDFVYVSDVVDGLLAAAQRAPRTGEGVYNICRGQGVPLHDMVALVLEKVGNKAARPLFGALPYREGEMWIQSGDPGRANAELGWRAQTSLADGIALSVAWLHKVRSETTT